MYLYEHWKKSFEITQNSKEEMFQMSLNEVTTKKSIERKLVHRKPKEEKISSENADDKKRTIKSGIQIPVVCKFFTNNKKIYIFAFEFKIKNIRLFQLKKNI